MAPTDRWDGGLIYASRAGLIAPQSVRSLARLALGFRRRFTGSRGEAGPMRDADQAAELILAKQRNGPTGVVKLAFLREQTRFANLAQGA